MKRRSMNRFLSLIVFGSMGAVMQIRSQVPLFSPAPQAAVGEGSGKVLLADVNRDGHLDLLTQHLQRRVVTVQLGDGTGRFAAAPGSPIPLSYSPGDIKLGDVNNDGVLDLGVTSSERDAVDIFLGNGSGRFSLASGSPFLASASVEFNTHGLQLVDINEDGKLDLITTSNQQNTLPVRSVTSATIPLPSPLPTSIEISGTIWLPPQWTASPCCSTATADSRPRRGRRSAPAPAPTTSPPETSIVTASSTWRLQALKARL